MMNRILLLFLTTLFSNILFTQIEGDDLFAPDEIVTVNLEFPDWNYWTTLTANYAADENEYILAFLTLTDIYGTSTYDSAGVRLKGKSSYTTQGIRSPSRSISISTSVDRIMMV